MQGEPVPAQVYLEREPRSWHTVVGILAMLWGAIGAISTVVSMAGSADESVPPVLRGGVGMALNVAALGIGLCLVVGGLQLLRSRPSGVTLVRIWVPLTILVQAASIVLMITHQAEFEEALRAGIQASMDMQAERSGTPAQQVPAQMVRALYVSGLGCGGLAAIVPPAVAAFFVFGRRGREALVEWSLPEAA